MEEKTIKTLEFDKVAGMVSNYCVLRKTTEETKNLCPASDFDECRLKIAETGEAFELLYKGGVSGIEFYDDFGDSLLRAQKGSTLGMGDLLKIAGLLRSSRILYSSVSASNVEAETIKSYCAGIYVDQYLEDEIKTKILSEDTMSDNASEKLAALRKNLKRLNDQIREKLQSYVRGSNKFLQDNVITMRGDRYVVPVKSEYKGQVSGFIHDQSATGSTHLFLYEYIALAYIPSIKRIKRSLSVSLSAIIPTL